jgi:uncharacterized protein DUF3883
MIADHVCVPGLDRPVTVSEYAQLTGASEAAVVASMRAYKLPARYAQGEWWLEAPPNSEARLAQLRRAPRPNESEQKVAPVAPKPTPTPQPAAAAAQPNYEARPAQLRGDGEKIMTHLEYERAKFALEHALKQRSRRYVGLAILFCLSWAVVAAAFITSAVLGHWGDLVVLLSMYLLIWGWVIPVSLANSVIKRPGSELNHSIDDLQDKVRIYETARETAAWKPYEEQLDVYYTAMFGKRSGSDWFAAALEQYGAKIEEARRVTADFRRLFVRSALDKHASYYLKRVSDHQYAGRVRDVSAVAPSQPRTPPEKTYRAPRKVDWSALNQKGAVTGMKGEDVALAIEQEYLRSVGRKDLADRVSNHAQTKGDGLGYDILSFFVDGREKYIEVKSTTGALNTSFYLSKNELGFLGEHKDDAFLYRVSLQNGSASLRVFTATEVEEQEIAPVQFLVKII